MEKTVKAKKKKVEKNNNAWEKAKGNYQAMGIKRLVISNSRG